MAAGRNANQHEDETPLHGPDIDVAARTGWLMRTARQLYGGPALRRIEDMARATEFPASRVQRLEAGALRDADVVLACEEALGLSEGQLLAPIEVLCRTFPLLSPRDQARTGPVTDLDSLSRLTETLLDEDAPVTGGQWLRWARLMAWHGGIGLPVSLATPIVRRLMGELSRSASRGYVSRYEALAQLRCGRYGGHVLALAREWVQDPDAQAIADLVSAIGEHHTDDAVDWLLGLLDDDRDRLVVAGVVGLEAVSVITTDAGFWGDLLPALARRYGATAPGSTRSRRIAHLMRLAPEGAWDAEVPLSRPLPPRPAEKARAQSRLLAQWSECRLRADRVAARVGLPPEKMLARLLFDVAVSPRESRAVTTWMLLGGLPEVAHEAGCELLDMAEQQTDPMLRSRALGRLPGVFPATAPPRLDAMSASDDEALREAAMYIAGPAGIHLPVGVLEADLRGPDFPSAALNAAGMSGHPILGDLVSHERADVRGAARWWLSRGSRVVD